SRGPGAATGRAADAPAPAARRRPPSVRASTPPAARPARRRPTSARSPPPARHGADRVRTRRSADAVLPGYRES
ncbi:MAG TPA: hypothetical protein DCE38_03815, partial [Alcanivorax sp.]|nr:hypothetical protein [Alcanivorax sp.]